MTSVTQIAILALAVIIAGCNTTKTSGRNSDFTHGNVTMNLRKGETTQAEVLELFGPPNIATTNGDGNEVWTYQRHATVSESSENYATIILLGSSASGFSQSSRTMTLVVKFDERKIVSDFKSMSSNF